MTKTLNGLSQEQSAAVEQVIQAALNAADPRAAVRRALLLKENRLAAAGKSLDLSRSAHIRLVGIGKAAQRMALGALDVLGERVSDGMIITKHRETNLSFPERIQVLLGGHPIPDNHSLESSRALAHFLEGCAESDLVICLISGGGSALLTDPPVGIGLEEIQELTRLLLACGANIGEINTLRKHLDRMKGGGLARLAAPAQLVTLILSDVMGSPLDVIASGPTVADPSTFADGLAILQKYQIEERVPVNIRSYLQSGARGEIPETLKPDDPLLARVIHQVVASNPQAADAALVTARTAGFHTLLLTTYLQGEASQAGVFLAGILKQIASSSQPLPRPACLVAGGETTVTLRGSGLGGRNQEMALGAVPLLAGLSNAALVTLGTDGEDGPTDAAGAIVTGKTLDQALQQDLNPQTFLQNNDSYHFFEALECLLKPGPTGTNVNDLAFLFAF